MVGHRDEPAQEAARPAQQVLCKTIKGYNAAACTEWSILLVLASPMVLHNGISWRYTLQVRYNGFKRPAGADDPARLAEVSRLWVAFRLPMRCDHSRARKQSGMISWRTGNDRLLDDDGRLGISAAEKLRRK
jgi:hypothetical protein